MKKERHVTIFSMLINTIVITIKILGGTILNSYTLLCSAYYTSCDLIEEILAFIGSKIRGRRADKKEPFGVSKIAYISQIIVGVVFLFLGFFILIKSFTLNFKATNIAIIFIIITATLLKFLNANYLFNVGQKIQSQILISSAHSSFYDAKLNIAVLFIIILSNFLSIIDLIGCLILSIFIIIKGIKKVTENIIMINGQNDTSNKINNKIKKIVNKYSKLNLSSINLVNYQNFYIVTIEVETDDINLADLIKIENDIKKRIYLEKLNIKMIDFAVYKK